MRSLWSRDRRDFTILFVVWLLLTGGGVWGAVVYGLIGHFPYFMNMEPGFESQHSVYWRVGYLVPVAMFILPVIPYAALRWRATDKDRGKDADRQLRTHTKFAVGWVLMVTTFAFTAIVYPGIFDLLGIWSTYAKKPQLTIKVEARQWQWSFVYPKYGIKLTDELVLGKDVVTRFDIRSSDVIHSFWIPAARIKWDVLPTRTRQLQFVPHKVTSTSVDPLVRVQCAELCGAGHADMQAFIKVLPHAQFLAWLRAHEHKKVPKKGKAPKGKPA